MEKREKSLSTSIFLNGNKLVKTSYKHARNITMQPSINDSEDIKILLQKEIESLNHDFFYSLNNSTNFLNDYLYKITKIKKINNDEKLNQLANIRKDIKKLRKN